MKEEEEGFLSSLSSNPSHAPPLRLLEEQIGGGIGGEVAPFPILNSIICALLFLKSSIDSRVASLRGLTKL